MDAVDRRTFLITAWPIWRLHVCYIAEELMFNEKHGFFIISVPQAFTEKPLLRIQLLRSITARFVAPSASDQESPGYWAP